MVFLRHTLLSGIPEVTHFIEYTVKKTSQCISRSSSTWKQKRRLKMNNITACSNLTKKYETESRFTVFWIQRAAALCITIWGTKNLPMDLAITSNKQSTCKSAPPVKLQILEGDPMVLRKHLGLSKDLSLNASEVFTRARKKLARFLFFLLGLKVPGELIWFKKSDVLKKIPKILMYWTFFLISQLDYYRGIPESL